MIEKLKNAKLSDITSFDLIFYNEEKEKQLKDFCIKNGITYLPAKCRKSAYKLENNDFIKIEIGDS